LILAKVGGEHREQARLDLVLGGHVRSDGLGGGGAEFEYFEFAIELALNLINDGGAGARGSLEIGGAQTPQDLNAPR
jgi:hypothetical protein